MREVVLTNEGKERLERELDELRGAGRRAVAERLEHARGEGGELSENTAFLAAKEEQLRLERRIASIQARLESARIVDEPVSAGTIDVGAHVRVRELPSETTEEYEIVGSGESDPGAGRISRESPIATALAGHHEGEVVEVHAPGGRRVLEILEVR